MISKAMHAGIGMDVWAIDPPTARLVEEALALDDELTLSVRQGRPQRLTRHQVQAAYCSHAGLVQSCSDICCTHASMPG